MKQASLAALTIIAMTLPIDEMSGQRRGRSRSRTADPYGELTWTNDEEFSDDVFTFVRIEYDSWRGRWGGWTTDFPASDYNFSYRLQQLTSLKVACLDRGKVIRLTDEELLDFPFIYIVEPGGLHFSEDEVVALRRYLDRGGFLMVDDFWGEYEWSVFYDQIKRVFPDREPVELPIEHPLFNCVYPLKEKLGERPQIPSIGHAQGGRSWGITWERDDAQEVHYRAFHDDEGRMVAIICHNTDLGDGWEREGEDVWYFREFSEKKAYPLGINILFYVMTHGRDWYYLEHLKGGES